MHINVEKCKACPHSYIYLGYLCLSFQPEPNLLARCIFWMELRKQQEEGCPTRKWDTMSFTRLSHILWTFILSRFQLIVHARSLGQIASGM